MTHPRTWQANVAITLAGLICSITASAAPTSCSVEQAPSKTADQLAKEALLIGQWEQFDDKTISLNYADRTPVNYHGLMRQPGSVADTSKPLVVLLHGYPEFAWSWEKWLPVMGAKHDTLALDLKGYGQSAKPESLSEYDLTLLTQELHDLVHCMGYHQVVLVGHDWGGALAWSYSLHYPMETKSLVVLSTPHPYTLNREWAKPDSDQRHRSHYIEQIRANTLPSMQSYFSWQLKEPSLFSSFYRWPRVLRLISANMDSIWKWNRMLSWYRAMDFPPDPVQFSDVPSAESLARYTVHVPTLVFYGAADPYFSIESWRGVQQFVPSLDMRVLDGIGHFVNHDVPGLAQQTLDYIDAH